MIAALAKAARVLAIGEYTERAKAGVGFIYENLVRQDGRLLARYRDGEAAHLAYLDDYAFLLWGLLELYETTFDLDYLIKAQKLSLDMRRLFWDQEEGGFYFSGIDGEKLITSSKEFYDGALPSGNSVAALNLLKLARLTGDEQLAPDMAEVLQRFYSVAARYPRGYTYYLMAVDYFLAPPRQIVVAGNRENTETKAMLAVNRKKVFSRNKCNIE